MGMQALLTFSVDTLEVSVTGPLRGGGESSLGSSSGPSAWAAAPLSAADQADQGRTPVRGRVATHLEGAVASVSGVEGQPELGDGRGEVTYEEAGVDKKPGTEPDPLSDLGQQGTKMAGDPAELSLLAVGKGRPGEVPRTGKWLVWPVAAERVTKVREQRCPSDVRGRWDPCLFPTPFPCRSRRSSRSPPRTAGCWASSKARTPSSAEPPTPP